MGNRNKKRKRITRLESPPLERLSNRVSLSPGVATESVVEGVPEDVPVASQTQETSIESPSVASPSAIARASLQSPIKVDNEAIKAMVNGHQSRPQESNLEMVKRPAFAVLTPTNALSFLIEWLCIHFAPSWIAVSKDKCFQNALAQMDELYKKAPFKLLQLI